MERCKSRLPYLGKKIRRVKERVDIIHGDLFEDQGKQIYWHQVEKWEHFTKGESTISSLLRP